MKPAVLPAGIFPLSNPTVMINNSVIKEIYKKFGKPHRHKEDLQLEYFLPILQEHHAISCDDSEIILNDLDEFNPFRRFLIRSLNAVLEFDKMVAFVFSNHILFLGKKDNQMRVHMRPEEEKSWFRRIFSRN